MASGLRLGGSIYRSLPSSPGNRKNLQRLENWHSILIETFINAISSSYTFSLKVQQVHQIPFDNFQTRWQACATLTGRRKWWGPFPSQRFFTISQDFLKSSIRKRHPKKGNLTDTTLWGTRRGAIAYSTPLRHS